METLSCSQPPLPYNCTPKQTHEVRRKIRPSAMFLRLPITRPFDFRRGSGDSPHVFVVCFLTPNSCFNYDRDTCLFFFLYVFTKNVLLLCDILSFLKCFHSCMLSVFLKNLVHHCYIVRLLLQERARKLGWTLSASPWRHPDDFQGSSKEIQGCGFVRQRHRGKTQVTTPKTVCVPCTC